MRTTINDYDWNGSQLREYAKGLAQPTVQRAVARNINEHIYGYRTTPPTVAVLRDVDWYKAVISTVCVRPNWGWLAPMEDTSVNHAALFRRFVVDRRKENGVISSSDINPLDMRDFRRWSVSQWREMESTVAKTIEVAPELKRLPVYLNTDATEVVTVKREIMDQYAEQLAMHYDLCHLLDDHKEIYPWLDELLDKLNVLSTKLSTVVPRNKVIVDLDTFKVFSGATFRKVGDDVIGVVNMSPYLHSVHYDGVAFPSIAAPCKTKEGVLYPGEMLHHHRATLPGGTGPYKYSLTNGTVFELPDIVDENYILRLVGKPIEIPNLRVYIEQSCLTNLTPNETKEVLAHYDSVANEIGETWLTLSVEKLPIALPVTSQSPIVGRPVTLHVDNLTEKVSMSHTTINPGAVRSSHPYIFIGESGCSLSSLYVVDGQYKVNEVHNKSNDMDYMDLGVYQYVNGEYHKLADWSRKERDRELNGIYNEVGAARVAATAMSAKASRDESISRETKAQFTALETMVKTLSTELEAVRADARRAEEERKIAEARGAKELAEAKLKLTEREVEVKEQLADNTVHIDTRSATLQEENSYFDRQLKLLDKGWENDDALMKTLQLSMATGVDGKAFASVFNKAGKGSFDVDAVTGALSGVLAHVSNREYMAISKQLHASKNDHLQALAISLLRPDSYGKLAGGRTFKRKERIDASTMQYGMMLGSVIEAENGTKKRHGKGKSKSKKGRDYFTDETYQSKLRLFAGANAGFGTVSMYAGILTGASALAITAGMFFGLPALALGGFIVAGLTVIGTAIATIFL